MFHTFPPVMTISIILIILSAQLSQNKTEMAYLWATSVEQDNTCKGV